LAPPVFDPFSIKPFTVVYLPYRFEDDHQLSKYFVVLGHRTSGFEETHAICLKATSQVAGYENNREKMQGCVYYKKGTVECFPVTTVIQPDNQVAISHKVLADAYFDGSLDCMNLPPDFESLLKAAIANSVTMDNRKKKRLLTLLATPIQ
jgi:hypothetical protein